MSDSPSTASTLNASIPHPIPPVVHAGAGECAPAADATYGMDLHGPVQKAAAGPNAEPINTAVPVALDDSSPTHGRGLHVQRTERSTVTVPPWHQSTLGSNSSSPSSPTHGHGLHVLDNHGSSPSSPTHGHGLHVVEDPLPSSPTDNHGLHIHILDDPSSPTHGHGLHVLPGPAPRDSTYPA